MTPRTELVSLRRRSADADPATTPIELQSSGTSGTAHGWGVHPAGVHAAVMVVAIGLWIAALPHIDLGAMSDYGLPSVLPAIFWASLVLLCAGFAVALCEDGLARTRTAYIAVLVVLTHGMVPLIYDVPRYAYVYKHIAVIRYIAEHGSVDRSIDIYHNWPGFFAACAFVSDLTGVDAMDYANWAQLFFGAAGALAVRFVARGFTSDPRRVDAAVWIFLLAMWVEVGYLAPQAIGYFLAMVALGLALRFLRAAPGREPGRRAVTWLAEQGRAVTLRWGLELPERWRALRDRTGASRVTRFVRRPPGEIVSPTEPACDGVDQRWWASWGAAAAIVTMSAAIAISHQLTPFFLIIAFVVLVAAGRCRQWWLPIAITALTAGWIYLARDYLSAHFTLISFDVSNNSSSVAQAAGSEPHQVVSRLARFLTLLLVALAAAGWWRGRGPGQTTLVALVCTPPLLVLFQSYGGEGIYRIYAFMVPWLAILASGLVAGLRPRLLHVVPTVAVSLVAMVLFMFGYYGLERTNSVSPDEIAASQWFEENAPVHSVLTLLSLNSPTPVTARYPLYRNLDGNWGYQILGNEPYVTGDLTVESIRQLADGLAKQGRRSYVIVGPSQTAYVESFDDAPRGSVSAFSASLAHQPGFVPVFHRGETAIYEVLP